MWKQIGNESISDSFDSKKLMLTKGSKITKSSLMEYKKQTTLDLSPELKREFDLTTGSLKLDAHPNTVKNTLQTALSMTYCSDRGIVALKAHSFDLLECGFARARGNQVELDTYSHSINVMPPKKMMALHIRELLPNEKKNLMSSTCIQSLKHGYLMGLGAALLTATSIMDSSEGLTKKIGLATLGVTGCLMGAKRFFNNAPILKGAFTASSLGIAIEDNTKDIVGRDELEKRLDSACIFVY